MRIGISGAQSVGKTTLLNALRSEEEFAHYVIRDEITRTVKKYGLDINKNGGDTTQLIIMKEHVFNVFMYPNFITDRTSLDGIVYTDWLYHNKLVSEGTFEECFRIFKETLPCYDVICFIQPEFEIENDGVRETDSKWQSEINDIFNLYIQQNDIDVHYLSGSVRERVNQVLSIKERLTT